MNNPEYMSGTGNNFVVSEYEKPKTDIEIISIVADSLIDVDGVIFVEKIDNQTIKMHYYNNDGSTAELCVNGVRCAAKYAIDNSIVDTNNITVIAPLGNIKTVINEDSVSIEILIPTYDEEKIIIDNHECIKSNIGNPHLLVKVDNVDKKLKLAKQKTKGEKQKHAGVHPPTPGFYSHKNAASSYKTRIFHLKHTHFT